MHESYECIFKENEMIWSFQGRESKKCIWMVFWGGQHATPLDGLCQRALGERQPFFPSPNWAADVGKEQMAAHRQDRPPPPLVPGSAAGEALLSLWGEVLSKQRKPGEDAMLPLLPGPAGLG